MYVDALTLSAVVAELRDAVMGGRIQRIVQANTHTFGLEIYAGQRVTLLLSAHPQQGRVHLSAAKVTRGGESDSPLGLLLRKYAKNGFITTIRQPPLERVVALSITKYPGPRNLDNDAAEEVTEERRTELIVEVMGGRSNIILVDEQGMILDALKRVGGDQRRPIVPHVMYTPPSPAPGVRRDPRTTTTQELRKLIAGPEADVVKTLVGGYVGVSPLVAREALFRAAGRISASWSPDLPVDQIAEELRGLYNEVYQPSLAREEGRPIAFAPYHLRQYPQVEQYESVSEAMETYFAVTDTLTAHAARKVALTARLNDVRTRWLRQKEALARELERAQAIDRLRWEGEMIYGFLHAIEPGQTRLEVEGQIISLDPSKTPVENAQQRFRSYDKAKGAIADVPERLAAAEAQVAYLDETLALFELVEGFDAIAAFERELIDQGVLRLEGGRQARGPRSQPLRVTSSEGTPIFVGRSAGQNEEVTWKLARPQDVWLHARGVPGAHVVIRTDGPIGDQTLVEAAGLALYFSKARMESAADVTVCHRRDLRKVPGGPPGLVTVRNERTLRTRPLAPNELGAAK